MLKIKNLTIKVKGKPVVKNLNLSLKKGEIQAILGPNAAGKSSLIKTIMGLSDYQISQGEIWFKNKKLNGQSINQRAKLGISMVFQNPLEIKGVVLRDFLQALGQKGTRKIKANGKKLLDREINLGFSGGEKKISELLQMQQLKPDLLLIDEIDSGLDLINLKKVTQIIKKEFVGRGVAILLITHRGEIMKYLKPQLAHVMLEGKIICSEPWQIVWQTIKKYGYKKCQKCPK
jgi:Fe-S cluster assembly ATP-binding protein